MSVYDTERFLKDLEAVYQINLNARITAINTEKGDFDIPLIATDAWYFQNLNNEVFSYPQFVVWGLEPKPTATEQQNDNYIKEIKVFIEVAKPDGGESGNQNIVWQLLRYTRALEEVAFKNFDSFRGHVKTKVDSLEPTSFVLDGQLFRSAGVNITAALTAY